MARIKSVKYLAQFREPKLFAIHLPRIQKKNPLRTYDKYTYIFQLIKCSQDFLATNLRRLYPSSFMYFKVMYARTNYG